MKTKYLFGAFLTAFVLVGAGCASSASLSLDKTEFTSGEEISVEFTASADYDSQAWVGIIPSNIAHGDEAVNDQHDVAYKYLRNATSGTLTFTAPEAGEWDLRMHDTDASGVEVASVSFIVK